MENKCINIELAEKSIVYILNCLSITRNLLYQHTNEERMLLSKYFNLLEFEEVNLSVVELHRYISLLSNKELYNISNDIFFVGQKEYMRTKNFNYLNKE